MHHVLGVVDLGFASVQLHIGVIADNQRTVVTHAHVAVQLAAVLGLVQAGLVGLDLHAALAHDDVTGEGCHLLFLLIARSLGAQERRGVAFGRLVVHAGARRFDIRAGAVRAGFSQLRRREVFARNPVQVTVVCTARLQASALGFGDEHRFFAGFFT